MRPRHLVIRLAVGQGEGCQVFDDALHRAAGQKVGADGTADAGAVGELAGIFPAQGARLGLAVREDDLARGVALAGLARQADAN
jgi:hypothetical protein